MQAPALDFAANDGGMRWQDTELYSWGFFAQGHRGVAVSNTASYEINLITLRHKHHAQASGYDRVAEYLDGRIIPPVTEWRVPTRAAARLLRPMIRRSGSLWYHRASLVRELRVARQWLRGSPQLFHFLYGENSFRYAGLLKRIFPGNAIVCTYHTPPARFREVVTDRRHLSDIDALVVLSTAAVDFFGDLVGRDRVFYIPRGVDTEWFTPRPAQERPRDRFDVLCIGSHLRDFECLAGAAGLLGRTDPRIRFKVVTFPRHHHHFAGLDNVELLANISDAELLELYRSCHTLALPLLDATANNVIVEALACGLPVISTDLVGVRDYVTPECALLTPKGDAAALVQAVRALSAAPERRAAMAEAARRRALEFRLEAIAGQLRELYGQVMERVARSAVHPAAVRVRNSHGRGRS